MGLSWLLIIVLVALFVVIILIIIREVKLFGNIVKRNRSLGIFFKVFDKIGPSLNTALSVISLIIAIQAYIDSQESGPKQQAILEKTKAAIDSSTKALQVVSGIVKDQKVIMDRTFQVNNKMLDGQDRQWMDQQARLAQLPKFDVQCKFNFFTPQPVGNSIIDEQFYGPRSDSVMVIDVGNDSRINNKSPFYDAYNDYYKLVGEGSPEGYVLSSRIFSERQLKNTTIPIQITTTRPDNDTRYFYVSLLIRNVGNRNSNKLNITVRSLRNGLSLSGEGINAAEVMKTIDGVQIYSQGTKEIPSLTIYQATKEQIVLTLKVNFRKGLIGEVMPIRIGVYDDYVKNTPVDIKFKVVPK